MTTTRGRPAKTDPAFERAPEHRRWTKPLAEMMPALRTEAMHNVREGDAVLWAWCILRGGACVALRVRADQDYRGELRISRGQWPETDAARAKWQQETDVFLHHLGGTWHRLPVDPVDRGNGGVAWRWLELREGETEPARGLLSPVPERGSANEGGVGGAVPEPTGVHDARDAGRAGVHGGPEAPEGDDMILAFIDLEATGVDPYNDRIVEVCIMRTGHAPFSRRVNPERPIPAGASAVHGIMDEDVASCPPFSAIAAEVQALIEGAILVGFSLRRYDTPLLDTELRRADQPGLDLAKVDEIDLYEVWCQSEPRTLVGAAKRFAGVDLEQDAHSADADTAVLPYVLRGMATEFGLGDPADQEVTSYWRGILQELMRRSKREGAMDRDGKFVRDEQGVVRLNFGKNRGEPALDHPGLLEWLLDRDFTAETKSVARRLLDEYHGCYVEVQETEEWLDLMQGSLI